MGVSGPPVGVFADIDEPPDVSFFEITVVSDVSGTYFFQLLARGTGDEFEVYVVGVKAIAGV